MVYVPKCLSAAEYLKWPHPFVKSLRLLDLVNRLLACWYFKGSIKLKLFLIKPRFVRRLVRGCVDVVASHPLSSGKWLIDWYKEGNHAQNSQPTASSSNEEFL